MDEKCLKNTEEKSTENGLLIQPRLDKNDYEMIDLVDLLPIHIKLHPVTVEDLAELCVPNKTIE